MTSEIPCGIRHIDLDAPLSDLVRSDGEASLLAVFWKEGIPLGRSLFTNGELPVPGTALAAIAARCVAPAQRTRADHALATGSPGELAHTASAKNVSVIVCTRQRPADLARCLDSLRRCDPAPGEIIVVDNAPEEPSTRAVVGERAGLRYVPEPKPGLSVARNTGISAATGDIIAFTDDDVTVTPTWIGRIVTAFRDPSVGCATGIVLPADLSAPAAYEFEFGYGGLASGFEPRRFDRTLLDQNFGEAPPVWKIGAGANMAIRRLVLDEVGPFDVRLGAGAAGCSEDSELFHRALSAGWICAYDPSAAVFHAHRASVPALRRQLRAYMRGHGAALLVQFGQTRHFGNVMRLCVGLPWHFAKTAIGLAIRPPTLRRRLIASECIGLLEAPFAWVIRARRPKFLGSERTFLVPDTEQEAVAKRPLRAFLALNPYPGPMSDGLFFRDKMRAIHRVAPDKVGPRLLEIGGGQSGLSKMLYPDAVVTNADIDPTFADAPCNRQAGVTFQAADATALPFADGSFDAVTMFDLLEHVEDDAAVATEALRVTRPGGVIMVTTPDAARWRYPYYRILEPICPPEQELFKRWGHVRRGYDQDRLDALFGGRALKSGSFINPWLALSHDVSFSRLPRIGRLLLHGLAAPASLIGWFSQHSDGAGTEIAAIWKRSVAK